MYISQKTAAKVLLFAHYTKFHAEISARLKKDGG